MIIIYSVPEERVAPEHIGWGSDFISQLKQRGSDEDSTREENNHSPRLYHLLKGV